MILQCKSVIEVVIETDLSQTEYLTDAIAAHTGIFRVNTVSSMCVMSAVGQSWLTANTGKIVQIDGASPRAKEGIAQGSVVCGRR